MTTDRLIPTVVRFPPDVFAALKARAEADDRTMAQTIRRAVRFYLEGHFARPVPPQPSPEEGVMADRKLTVQIVVRVPEDLHAALASDAEANGRTVAQSVRFLLRKALNR